MDKLIKIIKDYKSLAVAFSGGVDSSLLLFLAKKILKENVVAITSFSKIHKEKNLNLTANFTKKFNIKHIYIQTEEIYNKKFTENNIDRCYICKKLLFNKINNKIKEIDISYIAHGENIDDLKKFRPGFKAACEMGIEAPFIKAEFDKGKIRKLAKKLGLEVWDKPSESCLATRIPCNTLITLDILKIVEEAENILENFGILECRVRPKGFLAEIKIPAFYLDIILKNKDTILKKLKKMGFKEIVFLFPSHEVGAALVAAQLRGLPQGQPLQKFISDSVL
jgi:pyridinium-3,5-biscarboxylic acid mononucleotide sulfurtransferase